MRKYVVTLGLCSVVLLAIGASPRYLEELRIGGGYGNSGADFEGDGDILTNGNITLADESALRFGAGVRSNAYGAFGGVAEVAVV